MVNIFDYLDYRKFLKDYYQERKKEDSRFSHRFIANKLHFDSGYFSKIIKGERHISLRLVPKFITLLKLGKKEEEFFETLVRFCKAKTHDEKNRHFENLMSFKKTEKNILSAEQYKLFDNWYYLAIREIIAFYPFKGDYKELAKIVQPPIKPSEAKKAIKTLEKLKLIRKKEDATYERIVQVWSTGEEVKSVALVNMQQAMMGLAKDAFDRYSRNNRDMSTLTLSISEDEYLMISRELSRLREKLLDAAQKCSNPDRVYQCNFAVFPVSKVFRGEGS
jgi:uncharacterized protein (TIGR02147 family)